MPGVRTVNTETLILVCVRAPPPPSEELTNERRGRVSLSQSEAEHWWQPASLTGTKVKVMLHYVCPTTLLNFQTQTLTSPDTWISFSLL